MRTVTPVTAGRPALADDSVAGAFQWGKRFSPLTVSGNLVVCCDNSATTTNNYSGNFTSAWRCTLQSA